jgi:alanyl aminopeptidase
MRSLAALLLTFAACSSQPAKPTPITPTPVTPERGADAERPDPGPTPTLKLDAAVAVPEGYTARLEIDPSKKNFAGEITIDVEVNKASPAIWLNATEIEVSETAVSRGGAPIDGAWTVRGDEDFIAVGVPGGFEPGDHRLVLTYTGKVGEARAFTGVFAQREKDRDYVYTQFEATGARRAFPCFDQPEFKTPWTLEIVGPAGQKVFANTPGTPEDGADHHKTFKTSRAIPSYLVAFAVGPFEVVDIGTGGRQKTPMRIIVPHGRTDQTAHAAKHMKTVLAHLEDYFDLPYPYAKLDSIALPEFFGAMENPGLITYAAGILLVEPGKETDRWRRTHLNVVAHELAHQWFGNLVTLRWWDDLWLNESFASWMAEKVVNTMRPDWDGAVRRVQTRDASMGADANDTTRPVRKKITNKNEILGVFDAGITYGKGSAVISMFEAWIGEDKFRAGMREYMRTHAWKTTTAADFFASLAKVSDAALPKAFATFIDQNGVPLVSAELECEGSEASLSLSQGRFVAPGSKATPDSRSWQLPVCAKYGVRGKQHRVCQLVTGRTAKLDLGAGGRCPDWVVANAESAGYYRVVYGGDLLARILRANRALSTADRIGVIGDVEALMSAGKVPVGDALGLIPGLIRDPSADIVASAAGIASSISTHVPDAMVDNYRRFIVKTFGRKARALGWTGKPSDDKTTRDLRQSLVPLVALGGRDKALLRDARKLAKKWLADREAIDRELLGETLSAAALTGDSLLFKGYFGAAEKTEDARTKAEILIALGSFPGETLTQVALSTMLGDELPMQATFGLLQSMLGSRDKREQTYKFAVKNIEKLAAKLPEMARGYMVYAPVSFCDEPHKKDVDELARRLADAPGVDRAVKSAKEAIDQCVAQRARQQPEIKAFLRKY